jgi:hypothetical protein
VEELGRPGTILGAYDDPSLEDDVTTLRAGETIVFYTDGLTDAYAPENAVAHGALESMLRSSAGRRPDEIIEAIKSCLLPTSGRHPRDDIAILVLQPSEPEA